MSSSLHGEEVLTFGRQPIVRFISSRRQDTLTSMVTWRAPNAGYGRSTSLDLRPYPPSSGARGRDVGMQCRDGLQHFFVGRLFWPDATELDSAGCRAVRDVPVLFDGDGNYRREANRYLRDRALARWQSDTLSISMRPPRKQSLATYARHLDDFLDWCSKKGKPWQRISYPELLEEYQGGLETGEAADSGRALSRGVVNTRADVATTFLCWAADRGLRDEFDVTTVTKVRPFGTGAGREGNIVAVRPGRLRGARSTAIKLVESIPPVEEVRAWLLAVRKNRLHAKYLLCRFMIETGVRLEEAVSVTEDQWPTRERMARCSTLGLVQVGMTITHTKGGVPRTIEVPLGLAELIRRWIDRERMGLVRDWMKERRGRTKPTRLFLSDSPAARGRAIQKHTVYDLFKEVTPRPPVWNPHLGRHTFACYFMLYFLRRQAVIEGGSANVAWIQDRGHTALDLLRRQLGHVSSKTTSLYLEWLRTSVEVAHLANSWHDLLVGTEKDS